MSTSWTASWRNGYIIVIRGAAFTNEPNLLNGSLNPATGAELQKVASCSFCPVVDTDADSHTLLFHEEGKQVVVVGVVGGQQLL